MPKRRRRNIPVTLNLPDEPPTQAEIDAILMATDAIIGSAGRAGVVLILNGSKSQKALRHEWDKLLEYGILSHLSGKKIGTLVDYCLDQYWLRIEYNRDGIPLLFHTPKGWPRVKQLWVTRIIGWFEAWLTAGTPENVWPAMAEINREIKEMLFGRYLTPQKRKNDDPNQAT